MYATFNSCRLCFLFYPFCVNVVYVSLFVRGVLLILALFAPVSFGMFVRSFFRCCFGFVGLVSVCVCQSVVFQMRWDETCRGGGGDLSFMNVMNIQIKIRKWKVLSVSEYLILVQQVFFFSFQLPYPPD
eukprot:TRINITY_DN11455_c0_g1_i1.p6 TRINITY_DN11455_c0_g1~~TRINITY_DN11455_c0_g1_i1.p6  ORF type:complete len:129 (-),score=3.29 TRINITY_DN11455_c0_g1_i1:1975-2361(-)